MIGMDKESFNEYVRLSMKSGVSPLEIQLTPIVECDSGRTIAFRSETVIHSVVVGSLNESDYTEICDPRATGTALFKRTLCRLIRIINRFDECDPPLEFISLRCPAEAVEDPNFDLYDTVSSALKEGLPLRPSSLCIEFSADLLNRETERARRAMLDMKLLKVKTLVTGCGKEDFPISKLVSVPAYAVLLDPTATDWADSRNKPRLVSSLVAYLDSMDVKTIAMGTADKRRALRHSDCIGFLDVSSPSLTPEEAFQRIRTEEEL